MLQLIAVIWSGSASKDATASKKEVRRDLFEQVPSGKMMTCGQASEEQTRSLIAAAAACLLPASLGKDWIPHLNGHR